MCFDDWVIGNLEKYVKQAKVIYIEIDFFEINKNVLVDVVVFVDVKEVLEKLFFMIKEK